MLKRILKIKKINAECVYSGREALDLLRVRVVAAVMLDLSMPDISGIDVLRTIRSDPTTNTIPVVLHSALDGHEVAAIAATSHKDRAWHQCLAKQSARNTKQGITIIAASNKTEVSRTTSIGATANALLQSIRP